MILPVAAKARLLRRNDAYSFAAMALLATPEGAHMKVTIKVANTPKKKKIAVVAFG